MIQAAFRALKLQSGSKIVQCGLTNEIEIGQERGPGLVQSFLKAGSVEEGIFWGERQSSAAGESDKNRAKQGIRESPDSCNDSLARYVRGKST